MRTFILTLAIVSGVLMIPSTAGAANLDTHAVAVQEPPPPPQAPQINVEVKREGGRAWYMSPTWMAIGGIALVVLILLIVLAARGSGSGGTTVVRG